jgi:putative RecB family exonuclease
MEPTRSISISQVQSYLACPLKYRFQYIEKIPRPWRPAALAFGTSVHVAVEWFHRQRMEGRSPDLGEVLQIFDLDWQAQGMEPLVFSDRESQAFLIQKGREMLRLYVSQASSARKPAAVEEPFEVELSDPETGELFDVNLRGIVDLIEEDGTLVDLKTAGRMLESGGLERHLQLSAYALAFFLLYGEIPPLRLDVLLKTKQPRLERLKAERTLPELSWTAQLIREVSEAILTEHFYPSPSWRCSECEYFAHCQKWRGEEPQRRPLVQIQRSGGGASEAVGV